MHVVRIACNINNVHTFNTKSFHKNGYTQLHRTCKTYIANYKIIHKHIGGRTAKLPNDTYNRIHASNNNAYIKHLYNNETANINRYTIYIKRNTQETLTS